MSLSSVLSLSHCVLFLLSIPKDMVILPYKDSLLLFSRYLQQLVMESLGKEYDLDGNRVCVAHLANMPLVIFIFCTSFWKRFLLIGLQLPCIKKQLNGAL